MAVTSQPIRRRSQRRRRPRARQQCRVDLTSAQPTDTKVDSSAGPVRTAVRVLLGASVDDTPLNKSSTLRRASLLLTARLLLDTRHCLRQSTAERLTPLLRCPRMWATALTARTTEDMELV